jgi:hypothetical protein
MYQSGYRPLGAKRTEGKGKPPARLQLAEGLPRDPFAKLPFNGFYAREDTRFELRGPFCLTGCFLEGLCPEEEIALTGLGHLGIPLSESPIASADEEALAVLQERVLRQERCFAQPRGKAPGGKKDRGGGFF